MSQPFNQALENSNIENLKKEFVAKYGNSKNHLTIASAPARINIIGEHIDYNGGQVFPAAINLFLNIAFRKRDDNRIFYKTLKDPKGFEFTTDDKFVFNAKYGFANYLNGVLLYLQEAGLKIDTGFEVLISSSIPSGSGLSSSAALELCFAKAVCSAFSLTIEPVKLAQLGQRVENEFLGLKSGIMDQFAIAMGKESMAIVLDTSSLEYEYVPLNTDVYSIVVMNTNKPRKLTESKYNERKAECDIALEFLKSKVDINFLCDLDIQTFYKLENEIIQNCGEKIARRVRHCITETDRVSKTIAGLKSNDFNLIGKLLCESHISLQKDYEVTGKELDALYYSAIEQEGCPGARMTGAGFSGCAIAIVHKDKFLTFAENVGAQYKKETGFNASFFQCQAVDGARVIE